MSAPTAISTRVIKLGGSLFDMPTLRPRFAAWLAAQPPTRNVVVVGGGTLVDAIRDIDRRQQLGDSTAHWLAIEVMSVTARMAAALLELPIVERVAALDDATVSTTILDVRHFLREEEPQLPGTRLPHGWQVTSDSIAARAAVAIGAVELVLLKSKSPAGDASLASLAQAGYVDPWFTQAAVGIPVRCVDLRDDSFPPCQPEA